jgi:hypothetical protein
MADVKAKKEDVKIEKPISSYCILNERVERPPTIQLTLGRVWHQCAAIKLQGAEAKHKKRKKGKRSIR